MKKYGKVYVWILVPFITIKWHLNYLVEADILKIMGCVKKNNTLSVVTSDIRKKILGADFKGNIKCSSNWEKSILFMYFVEHKCYEIAARKLCFEDWTEPRNIKG